MVNEETLSVPAPPMPGEGFNNLQSKKARVDKETGRPKNKGLVQLNVKVRGKSKSRYEAVYEEACSRAGNDLTKGDFFDMMLAAVEAQLKRVDIAAIAEAMHQAPVPPAKDKAAGRDRPLDVYVTGDLHKALNRRATKNNWTISQTVEHACVMATKAETIAAELDKPCSHCGKQRKR